MSKRFIFNIVRDLLLACLMAFYMSACANLPDPEIYDFGDDTNIFGLVDGYPSLEAAFSYINTSDFNESFRFTFESMEGDILVKGLDRFSHVLRGGSLPNLMVTLSSMMERMRTTEPDSYEVFVTLLERVRRIDYRDKRLLADILPIDADSLGFLYNALDEEGLKDVNLFINLLRDNVHLLSLVDSAAYKALYKNTSVREAVETIMSIALDPDNLDALSDASNSEGSSDLFGAISNLLWGRVRAGHPNPNPGDPGSETGREKLDRTFVKLVRNFEDLYTTANPGEADNTYDTNPVQGSVDIKNLFFEKESYSYTKVNGTKDTYTADFTLKDSGEFLNNLIVALSEFHEKIPFTDYTEDSSISKSINTLLDVDLNGVSRIKTVPDIVDNTRSTLVGNDIPALEHLLYLFKVAEFYGYNWNTKADKSRITSESGGIITLADALSSMGAARDTTEATVVGIMQLLDTKAHFHTEVLKNGGPFVLTQNSPALAAVESSEVSASDLLSPAELTAGKAATAGYGSNYTSLASDIADGTLKEGIVDNKLLDKCETKGPTPTTHIKPVRGASESDSAYKARLATYQFAETPVYLCDPLKYKTLYWALNLLIDTLSRGKAPYFYPGNIDTATGNILTLDGKIYRERKADGTFHDITYKSEWKTSRFKIKTRGYRNGKEIFAGLGGEPIPADCAISTDPIIVAKKAADPYYCMGSYYTIKEIDIPLEDRKSASNEEAFFKNLQWFLYQKRLVLVIPLLADIESGIFEYKDAVYMSAIGNGLMGMLSMKPFCGEYDPDIFDTNDAKTGNVPCNGSATKDANGRWVKSSRLIKEKFTLLKNAAGDLVDPANNNGESGDYGRDLEYFSSEPGDAVVFMELWGGGTHPKKDNIDTTTQLLTGTAATVAGSNPPFGFAPEFFVKLIFPLAFPDNVEDITGLLPPVFGYNAVLFRLLGFIREKPEGTSPILPEDVSEGNEEWNNRNRLTAMLIPLLDVLLKHSGVENGITYDGLKALLVICGKMLAPYFYRGPDKASENITPTTTSSESYTRPMINLIRMKGQCPECDDKYSSLREAKLETPSHYYPDPDIKSVIRLFVEYENRRRNGLLDVITKTNIMDIALSALVSGGSDPEIRLPLIDAIKNMLDFISFETSENTADDQISIRDGMGDFIDFVAKYPDGKNSNVTHEDWRIVRKVIIIMANVIGEPNTQTDTGALTALLEILSEANIQDHEIESLMRVVGTIFADKNGNNINLVSSLVDPDLVNLLTIMEPDIKNLVGMLVYMAQSASMIHYFYVTMESPDFTVKDIFYDLERLLASDNFTNRTSDGLLYGLGILLSDFAKLIDRSIKDPSDSWIGNNWFGDDRLAEFDREDYINRFNNVLQGK